MFHLCLGTKNTHCLSSFLKSLASQRHQKYSLSNHAREKPNSSSFASDFPRRQSHLVPSNNVTSQPQTLHNTPYNCRPLNHQEISNIVSLNMRITHHIKAGELDSALVIFNGMKIKTTVSYNSMLAGFVKIPEKIQEARKLFDEIPEPDHFSYNTMLACYLRTGDLEAAKDFFDQITIRDVATWNTMISGFCKNGMMREAKELFLAMPEKNGVSWNAMISGYVEGGDLAGALELFRSAPVKSVVTWTAIVSGYMKFGKMELAEHMFEKMPEKNLATWNAMISGYAENDRAEDGMLLFKKMTESRVKLNIPSFISVLLSCSNLSELKLGKQVHQMVIKRPLNVDTRVGTALLSMYCKCGDLEGAQKLFLEMPHKDVVTWNAMISGYAQHGKGDKAINLFDEMNYQGIKPDWITIVGILSACNHAGFVDLGIWYFENMKTAFGINPRSEHFTCMVDLLGRAGKLDEAVELINQMPFRPNAAVFGSLLGACRIHKNLEVAEYAAMNLLNCSPTNAVGYVQLANIYAVKNKWESVSRVRKSMKEIRLVKPPGCSWIEVKNVVHEFRSGDRNHPEMKSIDEKLYELGKKMKLAGYVPDLESALHDVEEDHKEQLLLRHSEKLAIAYGLLRLPSGIPIRVFKNLRVCGDCHHAMKYISAIEGREIIVRDTMRFHHFKQGRCSCGDYW